MPLTNPFTAITLDGEVILLNRLHSRLKTNVLATREQFSDLMKASFDHCRLEGRALSDDLGFSYSTVHRWIDGRTAPHPSLWPRVVDWVSKALEVRIDALRQAGRVDAGPHGAAAP